MIRFHRKPDLVYGPIRVSLWSAEQGHFTYAISKIRGGRFKASAKRYDGTPFDGTTNWLGGNFLSFAKAKTACEEFAGRTAN